jgi:NAD(P)-dependent dehydrogenase (short-subunit alcohol dehydrogenase family)
MSKLDGKNVLVVGASRGLGRGIAEQFSAAGANVTALARSGPALEQLAAAIPTIGIEVADATDSSVVNTMLERHKPDVLVLVAGAQPTMLPLQEQTWETFSRNWEVDVRMTFEWIRKALVLPLAAGSQILVMSSGAAIPGSPMTGGYAGAKAMQRFLAAYANEESTRADLGITVSAVLPGMTPETDIGRAAIATYADRAGVSEQQLSQRIPPPVTPLTAGDAFVALASGEHSPGAYTVTGTGLQELTPGRF